MWYLLYLQLRWAVSDKNLTKNSEKLLHGDVVLNDCDFDIAESVGSVQAKLYIPAITKGKSQLSALKVEETKSIAHVWIHVERVIECVKQKFPMLQSTIAIKF